MAISTTLFIISVLVVAIWVLIEVRRLRHKLLGIFLIALILFSYISVSIIFKGQEIDFKTIPGVITATKLYFSWLGSVFVNFKTITSKVVEMDWGSNKTVEEIDTESIFYFKK